MSKVVVITGASSGIGEATAKLLAEQGNQIVLGARRADRLEKIVKDIKNVGGQAVYSETDVTNLDSVNGLAQKALDAFGRIDVWMNGAGLMPQSPFSEGRVKDWNMMIDVNIKGVLNGIDSSLSIMRKQGIGQYINIASIAAHLTHVNGGVYSATKAAVLMISDALRQEEAAAKSGIRVTVVSPGAVNTELVANMTDPEVKKGTEEFYKNYAISPERIAKAIVEAINLPEDTSINEIVIRPTNQIA
ncbi:SDR family oxidoreductase [Fructilactobacillus florum]|uniref:Short-chain dehydrogenase n=1 Tax=Fructilactobacillus florum DSM 22689 = JCM 16035 TaxID=1423745 RepID=A0A0R2CVA4_9LACO|nr:SDR family oxidoreductase [Fructilactobacillus florum]KRM91878.1 short-chain dehydrogenase [Fructilactobacillus florum DSM 22689 = JCM 16035]